MIETMPVKQFMSLGHDHDQFIPDEFFKCAADQANNDSLPCR